MRNLPVVHQQLCKSRLAEYLHSCRTHDRIITAMQVLIIKSTGCCGLQLEHVSSAFLLGIIICCFYLHCLYGPLLAEVASSLGVRTSVCCVSGQNK